MDKTFCGSCFTYLAVVKLAVVLTTLAVSRIGSTFSKLAVLFINSKFEYNYLNLQLNFHW